MQLDPDTCYSVLLTRDRRFDGWFYVGVSSTGVYCRPVCAVRTPLKRNCSFYPSAAAAEQAGYRPCLRCRPELAPGHGVLDLSGQLARAAAALIDQGLTDPAGLSAVARRQFGAAAQAGPIARLLRRRRAGIEAAVAPQRRAHGTHRPAIHPGGRDAHIKPAIEAAVAGEQRAVTGVGIELHAFTLVARRAAVWPKTDISSPRRCAPRPYFLRNTALRSTKRKKSGYSCPAAAQQTG